MGFFSTFDLKFKEKQYQEHINEFGKENVVLIKKSKLFLRIKIILPILQWGILLGLAIFLIRKMTGRVNNIFYGLAIFTTALWLIPNIRIIKTIFDYKMDFIILTPNSLIRYDQNGLFNRSSKIIELQHLKTVSVRKKGILDSVFDNGFLLFLSEGGNIGGESAKQIKGNLGEIIFGFVHQPEKYKKEINRLLDYNSTGGKIKKY